MPELPKNSVALYRICSEKSTLGFGKYADLPVGDILKIDRQYIVWCYAHYDKISFKHEILESLGCRIIPKPGHDEEIMHEWCRAESAKYSREQQERGYYKRLRGKRAEAYAKLHRAEKETYYTKAQLQAINHGKMK